jgi:hypothetical protein
MSATILATLLSFVAVSTVLGAVTIGSAGNVPRAGTSTGTVTFTFTESAAACLVNPLPASPDLTVTIDQAGVTFSGTPTVSAPGSLGATASASGGVLTINLTGSDPLNVETLVISGLTLSATAAAPLGGVTATLAGDAATVACFTGGTTTATGVVATGIAAGSTSVIINVDDCSFAVTDTVDLVPGVLSFGTSPETRNITAIAAGPGAGQQTLTIQATANVHNLGETVSQSGVPACQTATLSGLGTVVDSIIYNAPASVTNVFPGEPNQAVSSLSITERTAGFISVGRTITFTIDTAGVVFSNAPVASDNDATFAFSGGALSADRKSVSYTVTGASTAPATFTLSSIMYDVASTVPSGTQISVTAAVSGRVVVPTTRVNAVVGRIFTATSPAPNVNIGQNAQAAGLITIVEVAAGSFTDGSGANNVFEICLVGAGVSFTSPGPTATVVGGTTAGLLRLREGAGASPDNIVPGTADPNAPGCYYWTVFTKSTTASTITIGSSATAGPLVNIASGSTPGALNAALFSGTLDDPATGANERVMTQQVALVIANKVFASQVQVSAASQPIIAPGATHARAGNIIIQETGNGQLKLGQAICVEIVPNAQTNILPDVFLSGLNTADLPVAAGTNGIVVSTVTMSPNTCNGLVGTPGALPESFGFTIQQQSTTGNGKVEISNIHYSAVNDAALGPVQVNVFGFAVGGASIDFQRIISNASIGNPVAGTAATRLGVTQVGAFTTSTKVTTRGRYVTYRFDFGVAAAGRAVQIWGATKTGNDWSAFTVVTTRIANASGVVYYYIRQNAATWRSYRGFNVSGGAWTPARQARWL